MGPFKRVASDRRSGVYGLRWQPGPGATPLWLTVSRQCGWKRSAGGSESAVDANALPAQSKAAAGIREPGALWSAAGSGSATPLWLTWKRQVSWKRVAGGSESAVDANALPAQSKAAAGIREPGALWSAAGSGSATPLWLTWKRQVSWKRVAEGSKSAVDANALPAQSKAAAGIREPGALWSAAGSGSATPLWLTWKRQVSWKRVAGRSESAVDANALPAQSKAAVLRYWRLTGGRPPPPCRRREWPRDRGRCLRKRGRPREECRYGGRLRGRYPVRVFGG